MDEKIKILVIEDNPADARLISIFLKEDRFEFSLADYLSKGLDLLSKNSFDIIILDLTLPDSSGLETFKKVIKYASETPIIVLTGLNDESVGINAVQLGAQDFMTKEELNEKELNRSINYSIERYKLLKKLSEKTNQLVEKSKDLEREQLKLKKAQKLAHIGNWDWDIINDTVFWSDELCNIYGTTCPLFDAHFEKFLEFVHPDDLEYVKTTLEAAAKNVKHIDFKHRIIRPDKVEKMIHVIGDVVTTQDGNPARIEGTSQDITERFYGEEMEKLVLAATQSYNSVIIFDKEGKVEWVNQGFIKLTGYTLEEFKNQSIKVLRKDDDSGLLQQKQKLRIILKNKKPVTYENINYTKEGKPYWVLSTLTPVLNDNGEVQNIIAIDADISELKNTQKLLAEAIEKAEEATRLKQKFLANMSHEIRTPMNAIIGFSDMLIEGELKKQEREYVSAIKMAGENLLAIINDILDISKIEAGMMTFEEHAFSVKKVIKMISSIFKPKAKEKGLELIIENDENIPGSLLGDPTRLTQIITNLIGNSIKFTSKGSVTLRVRVLKKEADNQKDDSVLLEVSVIDTGIGIPQDKLESIFDRFVQAESRTTRKYGGTGLGLSIAKQLIDLQGGELVVESKVNKGSLFKFTIPYKKSKETQKTKEDSKKFDPNELNKLNILMAEDNPLNIKLITSLFSKHNLKLQIAENGKEVIDKLKEHTFDIILMDMEMPVMSGYDATIIIRKELKNNIPIIAMTANAMADEKEKCLSLGMNDYISKPINANQLFEKMYYLTINP